MSWIRRASRRAGFTTSVAVALIGLTSTAAAAADGDEYVKYYVVSAGYQGKPENLPEIAGRLLGEGSRSAELYSLNSGRRQPDGGALADPAKLKSGWMLVLPWDAYGEGVRYGALPDKGAKPGRPAKPDPRTSGGNGAPGGVPASGSKPSVGPTRGPAKPADCATSAASSSVSDWASLRLTVAQAWPQSRGKGQLVAVLDSGVDGGVPQLAGHVALGSDLVSGSGRGDTDCLGTGTAMAGLIVAQPVKGSAVSGMAPDATVLPIRVAGKQPKATGAVGAAAIDAAVASGATIIAVGSYVDVDQAEVAKAVTAAVNKGIVVVAGAAPESAPVDKAATDDGVVRVGGVGIDGQTAAKYRLGGVDVVAPGVNVSSVGITGTGSVANSGTQYAVAYVAGQAALIRAAYPELTPQQVRHRIEKTAQPMGTGKMPDARSGWGLISPAAAVTEVLPEEAQAANKDKPAAPPSSPHRHEVLVLVIVALVALFAATFLTLRIKRLLTAGEPADLILEPMPAGHWSDDPQAAPGLPGQPTVGLPARRGGGLQRPDEPTAPPAEEAGPGLQRARVGGEPHPDQQRANPATASDLGTAADGQATGRASTTTS